MELFFASLRVATLRRSGLTLLALLAGVTISVIPRAEAALLAYEPFATNATVTYAAGDFLHGKGGGTGFAGLWTDNQNPSLVEMDQVSSGSLGFGSLLTSGSSAQLVTPEATGGTVTRRLATIAPPTGATTWVSFLLRGDFPSARSLLSDDLFYLRTQPNTTGAAPLFGVFGSQGQNLFGLGLSTNPANPVLSGVPFALSQTYLVVGSITWNAVSTNETVNLFVNPTPGLSTPDSGIAATRSDLNIATGTGTNRLFDVQFLGSSTNSVWTVDELRIGESFADVTPIPEPSVATALLAAAGILPVVRNRRRRRSGPDGPDRG